MNELPAILKFLKESSGIWNFAAVFLLIYISIKYNLVLQTLREIKEKMDNSVTHENCKRTHDQLEIRVENLERKDK